MKKVVWGRDLRGNGRGRRQGRRRWQGREGEIFEMRKKCRSKTVHGLPLSSALTSFPVLILCQGILIHLDLNVGHNNEKVLLKSIYKSHDPLGNMESWQKWVSSVRFFIVITWEQKIKRWSDLCLSNRTLHLRCHFDLQPRQGLLHLFV